MAAAASERGVPCVVVAGQVWISARAAGVAETYSLADELGSVEAALARPTDGLHAIGATLARRWHP